MNKQDVYIYEFTTTRLCIKHYTTNCLARSMVYYIHYTTPVGVDCAMSNLEFLNQAQV